jgi:hypothetical protein
MERTKLVLYPCHAFFKAGDPLFKAGEAVFDAAKARALLAEREHHRVDVGALAFDHGSELHNALRKIPAARLTARLRRATSYRSLSETDPPSLGSRSGDLPRV